MLFVYFVPDTRRDQNLTKIFKLFWFPKVRLSQVADTETSVGGKSTIHLQYRFVLAYDLIYKNKIL
jgi:hypothetical protein